MAGKAPASESEAGRQRPSQCKNSLIHEVKRFAGGVEPTAKRSKK